MRALMPITKYHQYNKKPRKDLHPSKNQWALNTLNETPYIFFANLCIIDFLLAVIYFFNGFFMRDVKTLRLF
jgi:hypothetical protein